MINNSQKGVSLYYAVLIMSLSLGVALGLNTIAIQSLKITRKVEKSPPALYAADTGIERSLYELSVTGNWNKGEEHEINLDGSKYQVEIIEPGNSNCPADVIYCIRSIGFHEDTRRAIRVVR
ncbi:MAG: hypothetical protein V5A57_01140 [Candidatus Paceibacterota bacterium]